jgi:hypothetical protein
VPSFRLLVDLGSESVEPHTHAIDDAGGPA